MKLLVSASRYSITHSKICIIGGGTAGLAMSAGLIKRNIAGQNIRVFDSAPYHYYQPGWTMVGADLVSPQITRHPLSQVVPSSIKLTRQMVSKVDPQKNILTTQSGQEFSYDQLIIASGLVLRWDKIKGAKQLVDDPKSNVGSIYTYDSAIKMGKIAKNFHGGRAVFTDPMPPIKCGGAPQKILYLWTDKWQKAGIKFEVDYIKSIGVMFPVAKYSATVGQVAKGYGINTVFHHDLVQVTPKQAIFVNSATKQEKRVDYDILHVVPPMGPPEYIAASGLGDQKGWADTHKHTLQHNKYPNIWALGDSSNLPCSKTAAAVFSQEEVLVKNLLTAMNNPGKQLTGSYTGYASCPIFVGGKKLVLAQFKYDGVVDQTFFKDQQKPRTLFYYLKVYLFPFVYWKFLPRGMWGGRQGLRTWW